MATRTELFVFAISFFLIFTGLYLVVANGLVNSGVSNTCTFQGDNRIGNIVGKQGNITPDIQGINSEVTSGQVGFFKSVLCMPWWVNTFMAIITALIIWLIIGLIPTVNAGQ